MPSPKRARQRAARQARMAQLRRAQQRRRRIRFGIAVVAPLVVIAVVLAFLTARGSSSAKKSTTKKESVTSSTPAPLPLATLESYLTPRTPPPVSSACTEPAAAQTAPTTTIPAKGNAVSIVPAPVHVPFPNLNGSSPRYTKFSSAPPFCIDVNKTYTATIKTDVGTITVLLLPKYAPVTVNNFVFLAGYHYFDGTVFHRVIPGFVDQGGDPTGTGTGGPGYTIPDEYPASSKAYDNGAVAMANTGRPDSGGSQFFIVVGNGGAHLSPSYSVFGQVTSGLDVVDKINRDGTSGGTPKVVHRIESVTITES